MSMTNQRTKVNHSLWRLLGLALALRLVLALCTDGYPYDMSCFVAWGNKLAEQGPAAFYSEGYFADYPPGYLWVLGLVGLLRAALHIAYESPWTYFLLALVPSLCDCTAAALVYRTAQRGAIGERMALLLAAFTAFNPLLLYDTGVWKQIDGAFALPLLLCFLLLEQRRYLPAAVLFGVALAIKPQALLFGPVLAVCFLAGIALEKDKYRALGRCFGGAALALVPPLAAGLPFFGAVQLMPKLIEKYTGTMSGYPYASINAFNWLAALGGNWKGLADTALLGISWQQLGWGNILLVTAGLVWFAVRSARGGRFSPLLLAAYYGVGVFTLAHCMHERYMVPGVLLTLLAAARWNDIRLYAAGVLLALDFMRFSQSRLATIDIYGTFFILLGAYCMLWYCQRVLTAGVNHALLPMALGGVAFGLGCASKWTGIYAGVGLAILYLGVLYLRWWQNQPGFWAEFRTAAVGGVLFYVLLPLCIYIAAYLPYWWRNPDFSLADWWQCQVSMFNYHATLQATHPFESRWYTWLLGLRPVWYYRNAYLPYGVKASIAGMAGPVICTVGLAALLGLLWRQVSGRGSRQGLCVLILYGTQLIPWMRVSRCTFLYHYFPSSMFCLAALALVLARMRNEALAKRLAVGLCAVAGVLFVVFYPALSGLPIPDWWADALQILPSFGFY